MVVVHRTVCSIERQQGISDHQVAAEIAQLPAGN
jgi:hypothetical protein